MDHTSLFYVEKAGILDLEYRNEKELGHNCESILESLLNLSELKVIILFLTDIFSLMPINDSF